MNKSSGGGNYDSSQIASDRGDDKATQMAREQESDDVNENNALGNVASPEGDSAGENKVATSIDDE